MANASWVPWITHLVPEEWRGRYLSVESLIINLTSAFSFVLCGLLLGEHPTDARFSLLYILAFSSGWISITVMKKIDSPPPLPGKPVLEPVYVWARRVWAERSFRRLVRVNVVFSLLIGCWGTFTIVFLRDRLHMSESFILYLTSACTLGAVASAWEWGKRMDPLRLAAGFVPFVAADSGDGLLLVPDRLGHLPFGSGNRHDSLCALRHRNHRLCPCRRPLQHETMRRRGIRSSS